MPSIFSRIIAGELPARFIWKDENAVAFLSNRPLRPGHTLVVPRLEVDHWLDVDPQILAHLTKIAQIIGRAQMAAFNPVRIGVMIAGLEVPHLHIHVVPIRGMHDLDFGNQDPNPDPKVMDDAAHALRDGVRKLGFGESVPDS
ncbi:MAG TPA: HIT family protein [Candidatus Polarisedimenticolia bacterium]|nr:HIT family protein [Candidatus Polarisedimenticolia bacterium]